MSKASLSCLSALLILALSTSAAIAETTYTCPSQYTAHDDEHDTMVITDLTKKYITVSMNLFTTLANDWSADADMSNVWSCQPFGYPVDQGSRVILVCACNAPEVNGVSPVQTSVNLIVAAGSQCTYGGNLTFTCQ